MKLFKRLLFIAMPLYHATILSVAYTIPDVAEQEIVVNNSARIPGNPTRIPGNPTRIPRNPTRILVRSPPAQARARPRSSHRDIGRYKQIYP